MGEWEAFLGKNEERSHQHLCHLEQGWRNPVQDREVRGEMEPRQPH